MICKLCRKEFKIHEIIDGKKRNLSKRKYCIDCSPFNSHNTAQLVDKKQLNKKRCPICKEIKPISSFYKRSTRENGSGYCKECSNIEAGERFKENKLDAVNYKGGKCSICGYNKCVNALEFHHLNPAEKDISFRRMRGWSKERRNKELDKCSLLCSNCHREVHANEKK